MGRDRGLMLLFLLALLGGLVLLLGGGSEEAGPTPAPTAPAPMASGPWLVEAPPTPGLVTPIGHDEARLHHSEVLPAGYERFSPEEQQRLWTELSPAQRAALITETQRLATEAVYATSGRDTWDQDWRWGDLVLRYRFMGDDGIALLGARLNSDAIELERDLAARLLQELADPRAVPALSQYLTAALDGRTSMLPMEHAAAALGATPTEEARPVYQRMLTQLDEESGRFLFTQRHAARALAALGDEQGFGWFEAEFARRLPRNSMQALYLADSYATVPAVRADAFFRDLLQAPPGAQAALRYELQYDALLYARRRDDPSWQSLVQRVLDDPEAPEKNRREAARVLERLAAGAARAGR